MSRSYFTEDAKMFKAHTSRWTLEDCETIHRILSEKGYIVNCVSRVGCDRKYHDALQVQRADIPRLIEQCFRQRLVVEVQAEVLEKQEGINNVCSIHFQICTR